MISFDSLLEKLDFNISHKQRLVIKALFISKNPLNANSMQDFIKIEFKTNISLPTIYKIFHELEHLQVVYTLHIPSKKTKYYLLKKMKPQSHLACLVCEKFTSFVDEDLSKELKESLKKKDFTMLNYRILLYGVCKKCQEMK